MNFDQALQVVQEVQKNWQLPGLLETLEFMGEARNREELTGQELRAYRVVFTEMGRLFAPA